MREKKREMGMDEGGVVVRIRGGEMIEMREVCGFELAERR